MVSQAEQTKPQSVPIIALLTDFGTQDSYVGVMKGVIWSICPTARIIDLTHHIPPQDIPHAAYVLFSAIQYMPPQTIVVTVVDPGVGSTRRGIALQFPNWILVGPDNGVFTYVLHHYQLLRGIQLKHYNLPNMSTTFHGRDVFSPSAAHLAQGVEFELLGPSIENLEMLSLPVLRLTDEVITGEVIHIDHFGNATTSIGQLHWDADDLLILRPLFQTNAPNTVKLQPERCRVVVNQHELSMSVTYSGAGVGQPLALVNSAGQLEIAVNHGHAAHQLNIAIGDVVTLKIQ